MSHKLLKEFPLVNMINYLTYHWVNFQEHRFLGFIPTYEGCFTSLVIDNKNFMACHVFFCDQFYLCKDTDFKNKPYILMFLGDDDQSRGKRFASLQAAIDFFNKTDFFTKEIEEQCLWYN